MCLSTKFKSKNLPQGVRIGYKIFTIYKQTGSLFFADQGNGWRVPVGEWIEESTFRAAPLRHKENLSMGPKIGDSYFDRLYPFGFHVVESLEAARRLQRLSWYAFSSTVIYRVKHRKAVARGYQGTKRSRFGQVRCTVAKEMFVMEEVPNSLQPGPKEVRH